MFIRDRSSPLESKVGTFRSLASKEAGPAADRLCSAAPASAREAGAGEEFGPCVEDDSDNGVLASAPLSEVVEISTPLGLSLIHI